MTKNTKAAVKKPSELAEIVELKLQRQRAEIIMGTVRDNLKSDTTIGEFRALLEDDAIEMVVNEPVADLFRRQQRGRQVRASRQDVKAQCDRLLDALDCLAGDTYKLMTSGYLASQTDMQGPTVTARLAKLAKDGLVVRVGDAYRLPMGASPEDLGDCCETGEEAES